MIQLHTFGAVNLRRDGTDVRSVLSQPRRLALLVYLATARPRGFHSRDRILGMFWPDSDDARGRNALRQALHQLRRSLGENVIVNRGENEIGTAPDRLWCDAAAFDEAISQDRLEAALELYRGDFLAGFFVDEAPAIERFIEDERLRFRRAAVAAAWSLAEAEETRGRPDAAAGWGRRALSFDPLDEPSMRRALELLDRAGERAAALQLYADFARRLESELELEPAPETVLLVERLKTASAVPAAVASPVLEPVPTAPVVDPQAPIPAVAAEPPLPTRPSGRRWLRKATPAFVAIALLILSVQVVASRRARSATSAPPASAAEAAIAVLPFLNMSGDAANDYFADGMTEELTYALSRVPGLRVVGHTSAFSFKGKDVALDSIGRALRVPYLLEGSVRTTGQRVRIVAQMIDAASGYHVWSNTWDGDLHDVFDFQAEIARAVVLELEPRLVSAADPVSVTPATQETNDPAAYADVLRGYQALFAGELEDYFRADSFFSRALRRDPDYARAHAGLSAVYVIYAQRGRTAGPDAWTRTVNAAETAMRLDPSLPTPHSVLAWVEQYGRWNFEAADRHSRRAIELSPGEETWYRHRAMLLSPLGRHDEAIALARRSVEIDPLATGAHRQLGGILFYARRHAEALAAVDMALALSPAHVFALMRKSAILSMLDRHQEAVAVADSALARDAQDPLVMATAGWVHARAGNENTTRDLLREVDNRDFESEYYRAILHAALGETERAFELLENALVRRNPLLIDLNVFPAFDAMREDPRMGRILRALGIPTCDDCPAG